MGLLCLWQRFKTQYLFLCWYKWELVPATLADLQKFFMEKLDLHMTTLQYQLVLVKNTLCICYNINLCSQPCKAPAFSPQIMQNTGFSLSPTFSKIYCALFRKATKHLFSRSGEIQLFCDFSALDFDFCLEYFSIFNQILVRAQKCFFWI